MKVIDYSLYLVTGRNLLSHGKDYLQSLEESIQGGVTAVQIREKDVDTREFINIAALSKIVSDKYDVPLLINDRVDVALAMNADGVHLGQSDMSVALARKLLPRGSIIGVSCNTVEHVKQAIRHKVDYIGIGSIWSTQTKRLTSPIIGVRGIGSMLEVLDGTNIQAVAIGNKFAAMSSTSHALDGIAVVSDIVSSPQPKLAAEKFHLIISQFRQCISQRFQSLDNRKCNLTPTTIMTDVIKLVERIRVSNPLIHQITNVVVATQSANATLAVGGSPIMATEPREMEDLTRICGALLINIGSVQAENLDGMVLAGTFANSFKKPIVFDPVGVGASTFRKDSVKTLLDSCQVSVIKGNAGELAALAGSTEVESKGVDSVGTGFRDPATFVKNLAMKERCVVVLTGPTDHISDGVSVVALDNGNDLLGRITGSGCILGSCIASYCAVASHIANEDPRKADGDVYQYMFVAAIAGVLVLTVAAELVNRDDIKGPGTFLPGLIDSLWSLTPAQIQKLSKLTVKF